MEKAVGIIGAGISGLLACKYALSKGFRPIVFESQDSVGGVWTNTIETTKLQTHKSMYQFSDFPWPSSVSADFPDHHHTLDYITSYAQHFDLLTYIRFGSKVIAIEFQGPGDDDILSWTLWGGTGRPFSSKGVWKLSVEHNHTQSTQVYEVNFVIVCVGRFSGVPNMPEFPVNKGLQAFQGEVIHAKDYAAMTYQNAAHFIKGKRITVVGFQKFAMDIATECSTVNGVENPCTLLYRTEHWNLPDYLPWGVPLAYLYLNRFSELMVHKPGESFVYTLIAKLLSPLRWGFSKFVESYVKWKLKLGKYGMVPKHSFYEELSSCLTATVPEDFYERVDKGSIVLKKSHKFSFCKQGIVVDGQSETLQTDLVILATGFKGYENLRHIFGSPLFQEFIAGSQDTKIPLYRECIHPRIPQLAVIRFSESIANLYTSEIRCRWVAELMDETFKVPSIKEMEKDVGEWDKFMKRYSGRYYRRSCIGGLHIWYNDQMCKDMGWNPNRKKGFFAQLFQPYGPMDYVSP